MFVSPSRTQEASFIFLHHFISFWLHHPFVSSPGSSLSYCEFCSKAEQMKKIRSKPFGLKKIGAGRAMVGSDLSRGADRQLRNYTDLQNHSSIWTGSLGIINLFYKEKNELLNPFLIFRQHETNRNGKTEKIIEIPFCHGSTVISPGSITPEVLRLEKFWACLKLRVAISHRDCCYNCSGFSVSRILVCVMCSPAVIQTAPTGTQRGKQQNKT